MLTDNTIINKQLALFQNTKFIDFISAVPSLGKMVGVRNIAFNLPQYDYDRLSRIMQETISRSDNALKLDIGSFTDEIVEQYVQEEDSENDAVEEIVNSDLRKQRVKEIRDWICVVFTILGVLFPDGLTSKQPATVYYIIKEINNYYTIGEGINAEYRNAYSYRFINRNNVMPRINPDCKSTVTGHLSMGKLVTVLEKHKKWLLVSWENESGEVTIGWIQNYKVATFK